MKRNIFLKRLLCIAVAPVIIARAIEQCDVKPEIKDPSFIDGPAYSWYDQAEVETKKEFERKLMMYGSKEQCKEFDKACSKLSI